MKIGDTYTPRHETFRAVAEGKKMCRSTTGQKCAFLRKAIKDQCNDAPCDEGDTMLVFVTPIEYVAWKLES